MSKYSILRDVVSAVNETVDAFIDAATDAEKDGNTDAHKMKRDNEVTSQVGAYEREAGNRGSSPKVSDIASANVGSIDMTCEKCRGAMQFSEDGLRMECPYCGNKRARVDVDVEKVVREKERTKREQMRIEEDRQIRQEQTEAKQRQDKIGLSVVAISMVLLFLLAFGTRY